MEQEPGPRGSPQLPQPPPAPLPALGLDGADFPKFPLPFTDPTANAEYCCSSLVLSHSGHRAFLFPFTIASKCFSQCLQTYSKIGMVALGSGLEIRYATFELIIRD